MKILLHICCAPCATYPFKFLTEEGHRVTGYFYNPNIHPFREYIRRREAVEKYAALAGREVIYPGYDFREFLRIVVPRETDRCRHCYRLRLRKTAFAAREGNFDAFTTTLLLSKHQQHKEIKKGGREVAGEEGVEFLDRDFRPGWEEHWQLTARYDLYKQQYCGCIYSEYERYGNMET